MVQDIDNRISLIEDRLKTIDAKLKEQKEYFKTVHNIELLTKLKLR